ncbi:hypothetical protein ACFJIW_05150 [Tahibacter sp. UC22_41]|uniref:hypothetical protein n=1 Tax=Tahibacter sp. UC22_41 TaxID=3350178 RepID=UPI0036DDCD74
MREQFHQGHAEVRHVALAPVRHRRGEAVEDQAPEAGVVLDEIVDVRRRARRVGAGRRRGAVEIAGTVDLEAEVDLRVARIDVRRRAVARVGDETQGVCREVAVAIERDVQAVGAARGRRPAPASRS